MGARPRHPVDGRAVRRARRPDPARHAGGAADDLAAHGQDRGVRHPRRPGGGLSRRSRLDHERAARPHPAGDRRWVQPARRRVGLQTAGVRRARRADLGPGARRGARRRRRRNQSAFRRGRPHGGVMTRILVRYAPLLVLAAFWEIAVRGGLVSRLALPPLGAVLGAWGDLIGSGELVQNGLASVYRAMVGLAAAIGVGGALGLAMATSRVSRIVANPLVQIFYPMPKSALIPLMLIWFGFGDMSKFVLIFLGCLLPVIISTYNGARGVEDRLIWSARSLGATPPAIVWDVRLPAALPEVLNGLRTAPAFALH